MILFPAIDLKDGQCVRLKLGDMAQATVFNDDPAAQAQAFAAPGFRLAASRRSQRRLRRQAGEWCRRRGDPQGRVDSGAARRRHSQHGARSSPGSRKRHPPRHPRHRGGARSGSWCARPAGSFPGRIAVGIDARGGRVAVEGWAETSDITAIASRPAVRRCGRRRHHLHRHRPRRRAEGPQYRRDPGARCRD